MLCSQENQSYLIRRECVILHADYVVIGIIRYILMVCMEQLHVLGILGCMRQCFRELDDRTEM